MSQKEVTSLIVGEINQALTSINKICIILLLISTNSNKMPQGGSI